MGSQTAQRRIDVSEDAESVLAVDELVVQHAVIGIAHDELAGMPLAGAAIRHTSGLVEGLAPEPVALIG